MSKRIPDTKKLFRTKGPCSRAFYYILNREFGHHNEAHEAASDVFAGGIMQNGHQCGMVFGTVMATGAEAYRRTQDLDQTTIIAILAAKKIMKSFERDAGSFNCKDITKTDFSSKVQFAKFMIFQAMSCFKLADKCAPGAIDAACEGLDRDISKYKYKPLSCASEVAKMMYGGEEEMAVVAGFAGGMGLSGNACGALSAAVWMNALDWMKENPDEESPYSNTYSKNTILTFLDATDLKTTCREITGRKFKNIQEHTEFINQGGCVVLMKALSES